MRSGASARRATTLAAVALTAAAAALIFAQIDSLPLLGWDSAPQIASARIASASDALGTFTENTSDGVYPYSFYRPVFNLSLALDHALFGTAPRGYHASDVAWMAACALALFGLVRRLLPEDSPGALCALLALLIQPLWLDVLAYPSRRMDAICATFTLLALRAELARSSRAQPAWGALGALATLLAVGAKEAGAVVPPLVFATAWLRSASPEFGARLRGALVAAAPHLLAVALVFGARFAALGELGGHAPTDPWAAPERLPWILGQFVAWLMFVGETPGFDANSAGAIASGWLALGALLALGLPRAFRRSPSSAGDPLVPLAIAALWILGYAAIAAASGIVVQVWHLVIPAIALCLGVGGAVEWARQSLATPGVRVAAGGLALLSLALWTAIAIGQSPLWSGAAHLEEAAEAHRRYTAHLENGLRSVGSEGVFLIPPPPKALPVPANRYGARHSTAIHLYSLPSWVELHWPERAIEIPYLQRAPWPYSRPPRRIRVVVTR